MSAIAIALIAFAGIVCSTMIGMFLRNLLPEKRKRRVSWKNHISRRNC